MKLSYSTFIAVFQSDEDWRVIADILDCLQSETFQHSPALSLNTSELLHSLLWEVFLSQWEKKIDHSARITTY